MITTDVKEILAHEKWVRKDNQAEISMACFRAKLFWLIPDMSMKFDYEVKSR